MPAKKQKQQVNVAGANDYSYDYSFNGTSAEDLISVNMSNIITNTIDMSTITIPNGVTTSGWTQNYDNFTITSGSYDSKVNINSNGIDMKAEADIKIGDRSLKDFMDRVEDRLAILRPNPELEERWDKLKELRRQYESLEREILEKEKMWDILKK